MLFPVGTTAHYNPVNLSNSGTADAFRARVQPGINSTYTADLPGDTPYTSGAVNATWFINEGTAGGSDAAIELQWNAAQELPSFNRAQSHFGHYTSSNWLLGAAGAATGSNPYAWSGSGITSFSPFSVLNSMSTLPIYKVQLSLTKLATGNRCSWQVEGTDIESILLERSVDGRTFTGIHRSAMLQSSYADVFSVQGKTFYRLKVQDINGQVKYSNIVWLEAGSKIAVQVYPTAFTNSFLVQNNSDTKSWLMLYDAKGVLVLQQQVMEGTNTIEAGQLLQQGYFYIIKNKDHVLGKGWLIKN